MNTENPYASNTSIDDKVPNAQAWNIPKFFLVSLLSASAAIGIHVSYLGQLGRGMKQTARSMTAPESERSTLKAETSQSLRRAMILFYAGVSLILTSLAIALLSWRRRERGWPEVTFSLWLVYLLLQLVLV
jgi:hypothetical protein